MLLKASSLAVGSGRRVHFYGSLKSRTSSESVSSSAITQARSSLSLQHVHILDFIKHSLERIATLSLQLRCKKQAINFIKFYAHLIKLSCLIDFGRFCKTRVPMAGILRARNEKRCTDVMYCNKRTEAPPMLLQKSARRSRFSHIRCDLYSVLRIVPLYRGLIDFDGIFTQILLTNMHNAQCVNWNFL